MPLLEVDDLHVFYGESHVLHGVEFSVATNETLAVLGRNGMGKTTTLHTIAGLMRPQRGRVVWDGSPIHRVPPERISRLGIGLMPQGHRVFPNLTVEENLRVAEKPVPEDGWSPADCYDLFPVLGERRNLQAGNLSGGQQQMLTMSRALVGNHRMLLLDEPVEGLDPTTVGIMSGVLSELKRRKVSIVLVEQRVEFALRLADRAIFLERGRVVYETDRTSDLLTDRSFLAELLGVRRQSDTDHDSDA